jgi:sigma-E factor negative regulatory protein RseC
MMKDSEDTLINHDGIVKENSGKSVIVSISASSACSGCHARGTCSTFGNEEKMIEVEGKYNVKPGDTVTVMMMQSMGYKALFLGYILPFISVLLTLITLISLDFRELTAGLASLAVLIPYYLILAFFRKRINEKFTFTLKVQ